MDYSHITKDNLHWMYGLEVYFQHINHPQLEDFLDIKKAVMEGNTYKIQKLCMQEVYRGETEFTKEFNRVIFSSLNDYEFLTHRKVLNYISHCVDDDFIKRISSWSSECEHQANFNDHFSRGQIQSKIWLVEELKKIITGPIDTLVHYGGWYATIAYFLFKEFDIRQYYNIEQDKKCVWIGDFFNYPQYNNSWKYKGVFMDVNDIHYNKDNEFTAHTQNKQQEKIQLTVKPNFILNTSCEHMDETWYKNLPDGTFVALQTNDYFSNEQHSNCVGGINEAIAKYPMTELYYSGSLDTQLYNRFMLIGKK